MKDNKNSVFETFLTFIRKERGYSSNTIDAYRRDINKFNLFLIKYFDSNSIDYKMVDKWTLRNFFGKEEEINLFKLLRGQHFGHFTISKIGKKSRTRCERKEELG